MHSLPNYSPQFVEMVCKMLTIFKNRCDETYKGKFYRVVSSSANLVKNCYFNYNLFCLSADLLKYSMDGDRHTRVFSANWTKDEDISRCLR